MGVLVGDRQQRGVFGGVLALVRVSAVGWGSDSLETAGVGADSFNSTDSSMHTRLLEGPISGSAGTWISDVSTVAGGVEALAGCRVSAQGLALT